MMKVVLAPDAEIAMRMLDPNGARRVQAWFSYLERWVTDDVVEKFATAVFEPARFLEELQAFDDLLKSNQAQQRPT